MRIVSYNILDGGEGRADPLAEILEAQRPDIVALIEADNVDVLERIARRLKMDFIRGEGARHAVAVLSHWPIVETINHASIGSGPPCLLEARLQQPDGTLWIVGAVHLSPYAFEVNETEREKEADAMLDAFADHRRANRPHILAGDFNSNSPIQQMDPARCSLRTQEAFQKNGGVIPRRVIQKILEAGYVDVMHAVMGSVATTAGTFKTQTPGQRVDYIFTSGIDGSSMRSARVEQDRLAKYASDHFPIVAEILA